MQRNFMIKMIGCCIVILFLGTSICTAQNVSINHMNRDNTTFYTTDDTMIVMNGPNNNFGSNPTMEIRNIGTGWEEDALVRFNISSIQPDALIAHATLNMFYSHYQDNDPMGRAINLYRITSNWMESTVTWNTRPSIDSSLTSSATVPASAGVWMQWDVTNDVQDFVNGAKTNYGWQLMDEQYWGGVNIPRTHYWAKENGNNIPFLETELLVLTPSFLFGSITNLTSHENYITFDAVKLRCLQFSPFSFNTYISGETMAVSVHKIGILNTNHAFGIFKAGLY